MFEGEHVSIWVNNSGGSGAPMRVLRLCNKFDAFLFETLVGFVYVVND